MISRIAAVLAVALAFYFLLPALCALLQRRLAARWLLWLREEALSSGVRAAVSGVSGNSLLIRAQASGGFMPVSSADTVFFACSGEGLRKIPWRHLLSVPKGIDAFYIPPEPFASPLKSRPSFIEKRVLPYLARKKGACVLFDGALLSFPEDLSAEAERAALRDDGRLKPYFVALGAFAEFCLFLAFLRESALFPAALTALAAVFGKGAPYVPPGLFLTMTGTKLAAKGGGKGRCAPALKALGAAINAALFIAGVAWLF